MTCVRVINATFKGRKNQNTNFIVFDRKYGFTSEIRPTVEWIMNNLSLLNEDIKKQKDTQIKIIWQS